MTFWASAIHKALRTTQHRKCLLPRDLNPSLEEHVVEENNRNAWTLEGDAAVWCNPRKLRAEQETCLQKVDKTTQVERKGRKSPG